MSAGAALAPGLRAADTPERDPAVAGVELGLVATPRPGSRTHAAIAKVAASLAATRRELAAQWATLPSTELEQHYAGCLGQIHRMLTGSGLRDAIPDAADRTFIAELTASMSRDDPRQPSPGKLLAAMLFLAGVRWSWIVAAGLAVILVGVLAIPHVKAGTGYKLQRIKAVYWPDIAEKQYRYQNEQAEIAVGSGGLFGKGFHSGTQGSLGFVPEVQTDFIFAVTCEETGFVGALFALTIYLLVISKLIQIARQARDRTGMLFVGGFAALLLYHVTVSVGMVLRLLPIMGIPLPFMSYGGSSLMATFLGLGLALNVRLRRFVN